MSLFLIDQSIIEAFERVSQRIEYYTNLDNFFFARVFALFNSFFILAKDVESIFYMCGSVLVGSAYLIFIQRVEKVTRLRAGVNYIRIIEPISVLRIIYVALAVVSTLQIIKNPFSWLSDLSSMIVWYLVACSPLDPDERDRFKKEKEARANFKHA